MVQSIHVYHICFHNLKYVCTCLLHDYSNVHYRKFKNSQEWSISDILRIFSKQSASTTRVTVIQLDCQQEPKNYLIHSKYLNLCLPLKLQKPSSINQSDLLHKKVSPKFCTEELLAFIRMNVAMGMLRLPQVRGQHTRCFNSMVSYYNKTR